MESASEVAALEPLARPVFVVTQTTLSVDDTAEVIDAVRGRYPGAEVRNDICYATTNRQLAVRTLAERADLVLVVGSPNSSNSVRLREVAEVAGARAERVDGIEEIDPAWYEGVAVVGLTAGASVPDELLDPIIEDLKERGVTRIEPVVVRRRNGGVPPARGGRPRRRRLAEELVGDLVPAQTDVICDIAQNRAQGSDPKLAMARNRNPVFHPARCRHESEVAAFWLMTLQPYRASKAASRFPETSRGSLTRR